MPLTIPPLHLEAPRHVEPYHTEILSNSQLDDPMVDYCRSLLPPETLFRRNSITVPIYSAAHVRDVARCLFRLNKYMPADLSFQKSRIDNGFSSLRALGELWEDTVWMSQQRESHKSRKGVTFNVGEVVRHRDDRWRGVVVGWSYGAESESIKSTSVTTKTYDTSDLLTYEVLVDSADEPHTISTMVIQSLLERVDDPDLLRIRHGALGQYFLSFNGQGFVPNTALTYQYPSDRHHMSRALSVEDVNACNKVIDGVCKLASDLEAICHSGSRKEMRHPLLIKLSSLFHNSTNESAFPLEFGLQQGGIDPVSRAAIYLRRFLLVSLEIIDMHSQRRESKMKESTVKFNMGQVVCHKLFGFRGVVVGWDGEPAMDVSRWDGVQHLYNEGHDPTKLPFYHVLPDQGDCMKVFGGERSLRYVCQENMVACTPEASNVEVEFNDIEWVRVDRSDIGVRFIPPPQLAYKYGEELECPVESAVEDLLTTINDWQYKAYRNKSEGEYPNVAQFHHLLRLCDQGADASVIQETVKEMRKANETITTRWKLESALSDLIASKSRSALSQLNELTANIDDNPYVEAWNKKATCEFLLGQYDDAIASTNHALQLDSSHTQALSGLGLIYFQKREFDKAAACFRKSLDFDPWSPVGSKLSICIDAKNQTDEEITN